VPYVDTVSIVWHVDGVNIWENSILHRYGRFVVRRARLLLAISGVLLVAATVFGTGAFGKLKNGGFDDPAAASTQAQRLINERYGGQTNLVLLVTAKAGTVDDPAAASAGRSLADRLTAEPDITGVVSYWTRPVPGLRSTDGRQALVLAHLTGDDNQRVTRSKDLVGRYAVDRDGITVRAGGLVGFSSDGNTQVTTSLAIAEAIAVPVILALLVLVFGSVVAALLPLVIGGIAIVGTFAELAFLGSATSVSIFAINLTTALGLGLGIDYGLFMVSRFREQLAAAQPVGAAAGQRSSVGDEVPEAVASTVATAGRTIVFSAATVAAALAALLVFPQYFLRSFAYAGIGVVAIAALGAMVVAPAMMAVLGRRVNAGRLPWVRSVEGGESARWGRLAALVTRRPALIALPVVAALLFAASPLLGVSFGTPDQGVLRPSASSRQVADAVRAGFPGNASSPIDVVFTAAVPASALDDYAQQVSRLPGVVRVDRRPDSGGLTLVSNLATKSDAAQQLVHSVRDLPPPASVGVLVGGDDATLVDTKHSIGSRLPLAVLLVMLTTFVVLFLFTGSVVQPVRSLVFNALSLSATLGVLTWIFQEGHLAGLLNVTARPMDTSMTVLMFCITFGLSMDYEVFVLSRIKELHDQGADDRIAVTRGLARTGRIVSAAAMLLAVSFFAFLTGTVSFLQLFGLGAGLAILIDATLVRGVLVPAAMRVLGRAAWYSPRLLRRVHARVALGEA
jgi:putative drug exporter of the RND superfamily